MSEHVGWKAASNGARKRHWFVMHHEQRLFYANRRRQLVRFGSCKAAQEKADQLNREHSEPTRQDGSVWFSPPGAKRSPCPCKTYRLRVGRLADGREAFAKAGYCISALGNYRFAEVWVRDQQAYGGTKLYRERNHAAAGSPGYRGMFALIVKGSEKRIRGMMPIRIAQQLGWTE